MRRRLIATALTVLSVTALVGPAGASGIIDTGEGEVPAYVCVDSRLIQWRPCVYVRPTS